MKPYKSKPLNNAHSGSLNQLTIQQVKKMLFEDLVLAETLNRAQRFYWLCIGSNWKKWTP